MSGPATRIAGKLGKVSDRLDEVGKSAATAATRQRGANGRFISSADKMASAAVAGDTALVRGKRDVDGRLRAARGKSLKEAGDAVTAESSMLDKRVSKEQKAAQKIVKNREMLQARLDRMSAREKARKAKSGGVSIGGAVAAGAAAAMVTQAAQMAYSGARVIMDAQIFRESTTGAFTRLLGSADKAKQAWKIAEGIAISTGANLQETASSLNSLLAQGMALPDAEILIKQMADLKALNPAANLEGITRAMMQIKSTGKLQGDELMQLAEAGLSIDRVYEQLSKTLGKSRDEVLKLQQSGKITSAQAIKAIQDSIAAQTKSAPGALAADAASKSLGGSINRIQAMMDVLMSGEGIDMSPVVGTINALMAALQRPEVQAAINSLFNALVGLMSVDFFGSIGADSVSKVSSMAAGIQGVVTVLRIFIGALAIVKNAILLVGIGINGWILIAQKAWEGLTAIGAGIAAFAVSIVDSVAAIPGRMLDR
jgi:tape measure domain-containing protein